MTAKNFPDDIPSNPIEYFKDDYVLAFDLISQQVVTKKCHYPEKVGRPLSLGLSFAYPLEHATDLNVLGQRIS